MEHQRIDEGVKRGPRYKHKRKLRRNPNTGQVQAIPAELDPREVLERYLTETTTSQIAAHYGVNRKSLVAWLSEREPIAWKRVQVIRALCKKEDGDEGIEGSCDALSLARAREQLRSGQWDLERLDPSNYGVKQELTITVPEVALVFGQRVAPALRSAVQQEQITDVADEQPLIDAKE